MAGKKVQIPVVGGLRKVIQIPAQQAAGTTIAEFGTGTISLAQLKQALNLTPSPPKPGGNAGGGASAALIPGPGLSGGGVLVGPVPINLTAPIPAFVFEEGGGGGGDGDPGPPGQNGLTGAQGPVGPAVFFLPDDPEVALDAVPGSVGPTGSTGASGPMGSAIYLSAEDGQDGLDAVPGPAGPRGSPGNNAPIIWIPGDDGADGEPGPPGVAGTSGGGSGTSGLLYGQPDFIAPPAAGWTWLQQGSATVTSIYSNKVLRFYAPFASGADALYVRTVTPGTFTVVACMMISAWAPTIFSRAGVYWRDSSTSHMQMFVVDMRANPTPFASYNFSNLTTFNTTIFSGQTSSENRQLLSIPIWLKVTRDGSNNVKCFVSDDGTVFVQVGSTDSTNYVASPNQIGVGFSNAAVSGTINDFSVSLYSFFVGP